MCGIIGYAGYRDAIPEIIEGLKKLEYRGCDSAGVAVITDDGLWIEKREGRLSRLEDYLNGKPQATIGVGHTRWATHGIPSDVNAHPHVDCQGNFAVVHNGIIENFSPLRRWLEQKGHVFQSQTDTEVLSHLIEDCYQGDLVEAVRNAVAHLKGSYAIAVVSPKEPDKIVAVRKDSTMMVGIGEREFFLASDIPAVLARTNRFYVLEDGEMAVLTPTGVRLSSVVDGNEIHKDVFTVDWDPIQAEKNGYPHFMLKEIHEQPRALRDTMRGRIADGRIEFPDVQLDLFLQDVQKVFIVGCGTAYHAGMVGRYLIEKLARVPVEVDIASEFRYREVLWPEKSILIVVSQSGETADTLAVLREAKRRGVKILAVTNVVGSSVAREADAVLYTWAGPEISVASTKAYSTQVLLMYMIAIFMAEQRGTLPPEVITGMVKELAALPDKILQVLECSAGVEAITGKYHQASSAFFLGRGLDHMIALEGALKLKEISYIHAEAYAAGELKHGTLALIEEGVPVISLITQDDLQDKMMSNIKEVKARKGTIIGITKEGMAKIIEECDEVVTIPNADQLFTPLLSVIPLQLLAYHMAVARGCDVDNPRNLAKSVTVE
ncbi:MAG: glutamine--fructose-6-phosphate transaminase (isomerizing) [Syntrophomonadaceae bacterium]|nr:glutamine--fructose-6-phosphate transaminase (isomerizing) [Syntrophomonadaceae bacterium]